MRRRLGEERGGYEKADPGGADTEHERILYECARNAAVCRELAQHHHIQLKIGRRALS